MKNVTMLKHDHNNYSKMCSDKPITVVSWTQSVTKY